MKSVKIVLIIIAGVSLAASTCNRENCHDTIKIVNNTEKEIYFHPSALYPDTMTLYPNPALDPSSNEINSYSSKEDIYKDCIEGIFSENPEGIIMYFIYDADILETVPWDTVVKYYMLLKRYDLTSKDLQEMNWTITYP